MEAREFHGSQKLAVMVGLSRMLNFQENYVLNLFKRRQKSINFRKIFSRNS